MDENGNYQALEPTDVTHDIPDANSIQQTSGSNAVTPAISIDDITIMPSDTTEEVELDED